MAKKCYIGVENFPKRNLPSGYTQVEYIESIGAQYIDTGFVPNQDTRIVMDMQGGTSAVDNKCYMFYGIEGTVSFEFGKASTSSWGIKGYYNTEETTNMATWTLDSFKSTRRVVGQNKNVVSFDGLSSSLTYTTWTGEYTMYLFGVHTSSGLSYATPMILYSCQIYDNGTLVRDYVPCINSNNVVGLYDMVNGEFYNNQGSGAFTAGNAYQDNVARKVSKGYVGVNDVARKIKKAYIGIGGVARPCWSSGELSYYGAITPLSVSRYRHAGASVGNYALFAGGNASGTTVDAYNTSLSRSTPTSMATIRRSHAGASVGNYALFAGGLDSSNYLSSVDTYNTNLTKGTATSMSTSVMDLVGASVGDYALFAGGRARRNSNIVNAYNSSLSRTSPTSLSAARYDLVGANVGDYVLFAGGNNESTVDAYNSSLTRTTVTSLTSRKGNSYGLIGGASVGDYALFAGGGHNLNGGDDVVDAYDSNLTKTIPTPLSVSRAYLAGASVGNYAIFAGGYGSSESNVADAYDKNLTRTVYTISVARRYLKGTSVGNYALFAGGLESGTAVDAFAI